MATNVHGLLVESLVDGPESTNVRGLLVESLVAPIPTGTQVYNLLTEALVAHAPGVAVSSLLVEALVSPAAFEAESQALYDKLRKHIPEERVKPAEPILRAYAMVLYEARAGLRTLAAQSDRLTAERRWLDLVARNFGVDRAQGESDETLRLRLMRFAEKLTREFVEAAIFRVIGSNFDAVEWFDAGLFLLESDDPVAEYQSFIAGVSRIPVAGGFIIRVPNTLTAAQGAQIIAVVNATRALGVRWLIIDEPYLGEV